MSGGEHVGSPHLLRVARRPLAKAAAILLSVREASAGTLTLTQPRFCDVSVSAIKLKFTVKLARNHFARAFSHSLFLRIARVACARSRIPPLSDRPLRGQEVPQGSTTLSGRARRGKSAACARGAHVLTRTHISGSLELQRCSSARLLEASRRQQPAQGRARAA